MDKELQKNIKPSGSIGITKSRYIIGVDLGDKNNPGGSTAIHQWHNVQGKWLHKVEIKDKQ